MNILIYSWRGPGHPNEGGAEQVTYEHAKAWIERGHSVTLFTSSYKNAARWEMVNGVEIIRYGNQIITVQIFAFLWYLFFKHKRFDLVVDQFHGLPFFTPIFVRCKILGYIHEVAGEVWSLNPWKYPLSKIPEIAGPIIEPLIFKTFYKNIQFLTVSVSTKNDLIELGISKNQITVINNGVRPVPLKKLPAKEKKNTVIFLGALSADKGVYDAIKIFGEIDKGDKDWQYWVVGKGGDLEVSKVKNIAKDLGITERLKIFGFVSENKKYELLAKAHIMVNPSYHEGWGLVNIEANSVGTPVVAYNVHGNRDSIISKETGILVEKGDIEKMAFSIISMIRHEKDYEQFRLRCIKWSKNFNWRLSGKQSCDFIESL